jgi:riboflavin kinase/FMN adenylyltransferase
MRTLVGLDSLRHLEGASAVAIGTFDGVHVGHRALIGRAIRAALAGGLESVAVTWDRHPAETLRPDRAPALLTTQERKRELIAETGVGVLAMLPFDRHLAGWPPERFVSDVLVGGLRARTVCVGRGWRFGHRAAGNTELLEELGDRFGFGVDLVELAEVAGGPASSSRARAAVQAGDLALAHALLGRPFELDGRVVHGEHRGRSLGFPTANLAVAGMLARPPRGVYAGEAHAGGRAFKAAISIGTNPQFANVREHAAERLEAYLIDFEGDLYGESLRVRFHRRLRDERRFDSVDELVEQIGRDVQATRALTC